MYDNDDGEWVKKQPKIRVEDRRYSEQTEEDLKIAHILDYNDTPQTSEDLDDFEFAIYALLRKWRHRRCAELDLEPYKIFQNKTLCIIIRMRRNNDSWGRKESSIDQDGQDLELSQADVAHIAGDLRECWGVGPVKVTINIFICTYIYMCKFMRIFAYVYDIIRMYPYVYIHMYIYICK
jgi:hypothetical protein